MDTIINDFGSVDTIENRCHNHKCSCCGSCCTEFIPLTEAEVKKIKDFLHLHPEIKGHWMSDVMGKDFYAFCPFLNPDINRCDIYPVRPYVCRDFKCDKSKAVLIKCKDIYAKRADYNAFMQGKPFKFQSLHYIFFNDFKFDFKYRRLVLRTVANKFGSSLRDDLTDEDCAKLLPMDVDKLVLKGGK